MTINKPERKWEQSYGGTAIEEERVNASVERKEMTTGPDEHGRQQKDRTPTSSPSTLTHETVQWDCLFEIIHPRRKVRIRVRLGEPDPTQEKRNKEMIVSYPSRHR